MRRGLSTLIIALLTCASAAPPAQAIVRGKPVHALALYGEPKYGPGETFDYVNPNAPKGGTLTLTNQRDHTFDTFNGFAIKGAPAQGAELLHETLAVSGGDEPFSMYCLLCETMEVAEDNSWIEFTLRPEARFHDGTTVNADDVVFSFTKLTTEGAPVYRVYYTDVDRVEALDERTIRFTFKTTNNSELPLILGQIPVLSKTYWSTRDFSATTLEAPVGTGPYLLESFEMGRTVIYKRNPEYWAKDLPVVRGTYNFDQIRYEYFRDNTAQFEAFKTGVFDAYREVTARKWATEYDFPAALDGRVKKIEPPDLMPMTVQSFILNLRRPLFQDRRVRQALNYAFDFESLNRTAFLGAYTRLRSYAQGSELEHKGIPTDAELKLLEPFRDQVPPEVFTQEFTQPTTDGLGNVRENLLKARELLAQAGWVLRDGQLINEKTEQPFVFEILEVNGTPDIVEVPYIQNLERLGIKASIRYVDSSQLFNRFKDFDFDATSILYGTGLSPGNEQLEYWGSESADRPGGANYGGVKDPVVDALVKEIIIAPTRESLITAFHALDRVLTWNFYRVLTYGRSGERFAYWSKLQHPENFPLQGVSPSGAEIQAYWWADPEAETQIASSQEIATDAANPSGSDNRWLIGGLIAVGALLVLVVVVRRRRTS